MQEDEDWVSRNLDTLRAVPLAAGALGVVCVLTNRVASGVRRPCWALGPSLQLRSQRVLVHFHLASAAALPCLLCAPLHVPLQRCTALRSPTPPALAVRRSRL